jgi:hypothetical protein
MHSSNRRPQIVSCDRPKIPCKHSLRYGISSFHIDSTKGNGAHLSHIKYLTQQEADLVCTIEIWTSVECIMRWMILIGNLISHPNRHGEMYFIEDFGLFSSFLQPTLAVPIARLDIIYPKQNGDLVCVVETSYDRPMMWILMTECILVGGLNRQHLSVIWAPMWLWSNIFLNELISKWRCRYEMVLIYQTPNAHVRLSGILTGNAMAAAAVKKIMRENRNWNRQNLSGFERV